VNGVEGGVVSDLLAVITIKVFVVKSGGGVGGWE